MYYRLKMADPDGTFAYSHVVSLMSRCDVIAVHLYPNPAREKVTIVKVAMGSKCQIYTVSGQLI